MDSSDSRADPLLAGAKPVEDSDNASAILYLRKWKKNPKSEDREGKV